MELRKNYNEGRRYLVSAVSWHNLNVKTHDKVGTLVHSELPEKYRLDLRGKWHEHKGEYEYKN